MRPLFKPADTAIIHGFGSMNGRECTVIRIANITPVDVDYLVEYRGFRLWINQNFLRHKFTPGSWEELSGIWNPPPLMRKDSNSPKGDA